MRKKFSGFSSVYTSREEKRKRKRSQDLSVQNFFPLLLFFLFFFDGVDGVRATEKEERDNDELLRKWLHSLQLKIPNESFSTFDDKIVVSLTEIECENFTTKDVKSWFSSSSNSVGILDDKDNDNDNDKPSLHAHVIDFGASCSGAWTVSTTSNTKGVGGKVNAEVTEGNLEVDAEFVDREPDDSQNTNNDDDNSINKKYKLPKTVRFPKCSMQMEVDGLHFAPSFRTDEIAKLLNKAAPEIAKAMQSMFAKVACEKIQSVEKDSKTLAFFESVHNYIEKNFLAEVKTPDSSNSSSSSNDIDDRDNDNDNDSNEIFNWDDSTLIRVLNFISSEYIGTSGPRSLNQFIKWFSNHTGILFVPREKLVDKETGEPYFVLSKTYDVNQGEDVSLLRSISFAITEVEFVGLDTADILYGPVAGGHYVTKAAVSSNVSSSSSSSLLGFSVGWNQTRIVMKGRLEIVPATQDSIFSTNQNNNWIENVTLSLEIDDMEIGMDVDLRVVEKKWQLLTQEQFKNMACLFGIVEKFDIERLLWDGKIGQLKIIDSDTNISSSDSSSSSSSSSDENNLEVDLQSAISNLSELITTSYQNVVSVIAAGEFKAVLKPVLNALILEKFYEVSRQECPKQNVKSLELIKTANAVVSIFFFILGLSCIALALLTYFVVPASFIRKLNRQAMKKLKAREMHDPFDNDDIDGDGTIVFAHESDEDTSSNDNDDDDDEAFLNDTTGGSKHTQEQQKKEDSKKKTHSRNRSGSAILASLLTTNESSDSYSDGDAFANNDDDDDDDDDDDEREEERRKRRSQREEYTMRFPETAWRTHTSRGKKADEMRSTQRNKSSRYKKLFSMEDSLSKSTPVNSRWSLRLLFIANALLFLSANIDSGASVSLFATLTTPVIDSASTIPSSERSSPPSLNYALLSSIKGGRKSLLYANTSSSSTTNDNNPQQQQQQRQKYNVIQASREGLFNFSLVGTVRDMWHAKVYAIAICIVLFSGVWPYVKLLSMFVLWEISGKNVKASTRGKCLKFVDRLGKWSLFDSFVMTMFMVGFRFHLHVTEDDDYDDASKKLSPSSFGDLDVVVTPKRSFYVFLFATVLSLVLGHITLFLHRKSIRSKTEVDDTATPLWRRDVNRPSVLLRTKMAAAQAVGVFLLLVAAIVFLAVGVNIPSIKFDFLGIAGYALGSSEKTRSYSLVELAEALPHSSIDKYAGGSATTTSNETITIFFQHVGPRFIQSTLYVFAVVAPLGQLLILCFLWIWPLTPRMQRRVQTMAEIFSAWSSLDVVLFAVVAAMLQIKQFANFVVGGGCLKFNTMLASIGGTGQTSESSSNADRQQIDDDCFDLDTYFEPGCWLLVSSAIMANFVGMWVMKRCDQSVASNALRLRTSLLRGLKRDDDDDQDEEDDDDDDDDDSEELNL
ncbi:unnamed protein product [Bathycoccus prasinos]